MKPRPVPNDPARRLIPKRLALFFPARGNRMLLAVLRRATWGVATVCAVALLAWWLAGPAWDAEFRLVARSQFVSLALRSDATLQFDVRHWEIHDIERIDLKNGSSLGGDRLSLGVREESGKRNNKPVAYTRASLHLYANGEVHVTQHRHVVTRYQLAAAAKAAEVDLQFPSRPASVWVNGIEARPKMIQVAGNPTVYLQPSIDNSFEFQLAHDVQPTASGFIISGIGLSRQLENINPLTRSPPEALVATKSILPGLIDGKIFFIDRPERAPIELFHGSDVRLTGVHAVVDSLKLTDDAIEVSVSGTVQAVRLHIGDRSRSLMPTHYDQIVNASTTPVILAILSASATLLALFFSAVDHLRARGADRLPEGD